MDDELDESDVEDDDELSLLSKKFKRNLRKLGYGKSRRSKAKIKRTLFAMNAKSLNTTNQNVLS